LLSSSVELNFSDGSLVNGQNLLHGWLVLLGREGAACRAPTVRIVATPKNWRSFDGAWRPVWFTRKNRWRENARAVCGLRIRVSNGESDWKGGEFHGDFRKEAK
jgi:hypothetical protein